MRKIIYNEDNLLDNDITKEVKRAKILIANSNDEILLAKSDNNYFFVGGHVDNNESDDECIVREVKEETGIDIDYKKREPFLSIEYLCKDYPNNGENTKYISNYYAIRLDLKPDMSQVDLTDSEKNGNFELRYIHKDIILEELEESLVTCTRVNVVRDTIEGVKEYIKIITK